MKVKRVLGVIVILALVIGGSSPFWASVGPVVAQEPQTFQLAPLNPDFLDFLEQPPEHFYGYVPPTMDLRHLKEIPVQRARALPAQPASWDWRTQGKVTPVKDQNLCGTCWIFGTTSVLESAVLLGESAEYDFSEQSVALCVDRSWVYLYDHADEPCGLIPGHGSGNSLMASEVFIKKGAVLESCNPYDTDGLQCNGTCACDSCPPVTKVTGYRYVTGDQSQIALIKNAVYQRPVTMSFFYDPSGEYTDPTYGAIYDYYPCVENINHLVSIIGWDDSVPHPDPDHSGTGAWLVKNSWGTADSWAGGAGISDGYFWLAYDSSSMTEIAYLEYGDYNANETLHYWDEAGVITSVGTGASSTLWAASIFTSGQDGELTHVDFWTVSNNASYEIYVYDGSFGSQLASKTGSCAEFGYYSIPLTTPVPMTNGQQFTVAVRMTTPGFNFPVPVEEVISDFCEPPIQTGVCFLSVDGSVWEDAADYGWNVCLRARILTDTTPPTMEPIAEAEGQYYSTAPSFSNFGFDDNVALDDGWYQMDFYAGTWTALFTNAPGTSWDSDNWTIPGFDGLAEGSHTIYFKASDDATNVEGESGEWSWQFFKDTTPAKVSIADAAADPSATVVVPVNITDVTDLGAADIWLSYDKDVVIVDSVANGDLGAITSSINNPAGVTKMNWFSATGKTGDFIFADVTLRAVGNRGDTSALDLDVKELVDTSAVPIPHDVDDGLFTIRALMEGDVSMNDHVTISDAMFIAQHLVDIITLNADQLECADTTDDGNVTISDAMHIAQWLVDPDGTLGVLFKPLWELANDSHMLLPQP